MVKGRLNPLNDFAFQKAMGEKEKDALQRWLVYFDKHSPAKLIEEDPALLRSYLRYEKAASDEITRIYGARQEGSMNKAAEIAAKMKNRGLPSGQIAEDTGLSLDEIEKL
jgi:hypothetical protein